MPEGCMLTLQLFGSWCWQLGNRAAADCTHSCRSHRLLLQEAACVALAIRRIYVTITGCVSQRWRVLPEVGMDGFSLCGAKYGTRWVSLGLF